MRRSTRIIRWIEANCRVPDGADVGEPLRLRPWQKREIRRFYDNPGGVRRAILSVGRKNGKTCLAALLLLVHLVGPEARHNSQLYSSAMSRDQAAVLFNLAAAIVRLSPVLSELVHIRETAKSLYCEYYHTVYRALSADATTAYGLSPVFIVHDELGQVSGPRHALYEALETATSAHENPLSVVISTQAPTDADLLSILIDDALTGADPRVVVSLYTADPEADPFAVGTIRQANPAFGDFQNRVEIIDMARAAERMPARETEFRNLILNQRVSASDTFVPVGVWKSNGGQIEEWGPCFGGLDLSVSGDLTACVLVHPGETVGVKSHFWLPEEGLEEKSRNDRVQYDLWRDQGYLMTTPGRSVEYEHIAQWLAELFRAEDVRKIAFDRYNMPHLRPWLLKAGLSDSFIESRFVPFGQGFYSMSPALRTLESMLLNNRLRHEMHPVLTMCAVNAVVKTDDAGNRKLSKKMSRTRIDGMVALTMAASVASEEQHDAPVYPVPLSSIVEDLRA